MDAATIYDLTPVPNNINLSFSFKSNATKREGDKVVAQQLHVGFT